MSFRGALEPRPRGWLLGYGDIEYGVAGLQIGLPSSVSGTAIRSDGSHGVSHIGTSFTQHVFDRQADSGLAAVAAAHGQQNVGKPAQTLSNNMGYYPTLCTIPLVTGNPWLRKKPCGPEAPLLANLELCLDKERSPLHHLPLQSLSSRAVCGEASGSLPPLEAPLQLTSRLGET